MKKATLFVAFLAALLLLPGVAAAESSSGTLVVTATVESSIQLTFESDASGIVLAGSGTSSATMAFGTISAWNTISTSGVTRQQNASDFIVSSPFGVKVVKANSSSSDYNLTAALQSADAVRTWKIGAVTLSTTSATVASAQSYGSAVSHTLSLTVPHSMAAGAISNTINFVATAN